MKRKTHVGVALAAFGVDSCNNNSAAASRSSEDAPAARQSACRQRSSPTSAPALRRLTAWLKASFCNVVYSMVTDSSFPAPEASPPRLECAGSIVRSTRCVARTTNDKQQIARQEITTLFSAPHHNHPDTRSTCLCRLPYLQISGDRFEGALLSGTLLKLWFDDNEV